MQLTLMTTVLGLAATATSLGVRESTFQRRGDGEIVCQNTDNINGEKARENFVEGQEYLRGRGTDCDVSASNECERVSCSNNAAVYLCTTDGQDHFGVECPMIADYIDHIFDKCQHDGQYDVKMACGTQENTDGWRVEVGMNTC